MIGARSSLTRVRGAWPVKGGFRDSLLAYERSVLGFCPAGRARDAVEGCVLRTMAYFDRLVRVSLQSSTDGEQRVEIAFDKGLADGLKSYYAQMRSAAAMASAFKADPTTEVKKYLESRGVKIPRPELFHAHAIGPGNPLPHEPERATIDRYIYIFRQNGLFEFKTVPGSPEGDDGVMSRAGACCCCNCGCFEVT